MGRPGLTRHRKFLRLAQSLRSRALARGSLELMWESAYESGQPVVGDAQDVETVCDWSGEPGGLVSALQGCGGAGPGFILERDDGRFEIHDFWTHAPSYVKRRAERESDREKAGRTLSEIRAEAGRRGAAVTNSKRAASGRTFADQRTEKAKNPSARNPSLQSANGRQFAATPSTPFIALPPLPAQPLSAAVNSRAAAVKNKQDSQNNFQTAAATAPSSAVLEREELEPRELDFLRIWNAERREHSRSEEDLLAVQRPLLAALLDAVERESEKNSVTTEDALTWLIVGVLREMKVPELSTVLNRKVWPRRLDDAISSMVVERSRPRRL
jgi:hypothetical protein